MLIIWTIDPHWLLRRTCSISPLFNEKWHLISVLLLFMPATPWSIFYCHDKGYCKTEIMLKNCMKNNFAFFLRSCTCVKISNCFTGYFILVSYYLKSGTRRNSPKKGKELFMTTMRALT